MIVTSYEGGYSLQLFEKQAPGGSDFVCIFRPGGKLIMYFEPEIAVKHYWPNVQGAILAFIHSDKEQLREKGEIE